VDPDERLANLSHGEFATVTRPRLLVGDHRVSPRWGPYDELAARVCSLRTRSYPSRFASWQVGVVIALQKLGPPSLRDLANSQGFLVAFTLCLT
jgi:hypothetical protein